MKKSTKKLTLASMLCALNVVLLLIGSFVEIIDLSAAALASFVIIFAVIELGRAYPALIWAVSGALSVLLLPNKLPAIYFSMFFGWYPIVKNVLEKLPAVISWVLKIISFMISFGGVVYLSSFVVGAEELTADLTPWLAVLGVVVFVVYDVALTRIISAYLNVWRRKLKIKL